MLMSLRPVPFVLAPDPVWMWGSRPPAAPRTGRPVKDMKDLGRQRFEGHSDTLSGRLGLLSISWRPPLLLEETPVSWRRRGVWRSQMALVDLPEALLPNEDDDCRTWLMSWTPTVVGGELEACLGACVPRPGAGMCVLVIVLCRACRLNPTQANHLQA